MKNRVQGPACPCLQPAKLAALLMIGGLTGSLMAAQAQTAPGFGAGTTGGAAAADGEEKTFRILTVKHVYVGGIAGMFKGTGIIPTGPFVSPAGANMGNNQGGGNQGGFGGNQGGFGGNQGGFGGNQGGFGGNQGGFGGGMGGFGGGFGGNQGGFGGNFGGNTTRRRR